MVKWINYVGHLKWVSVKILCSSLSILFLSLVLWKGNFGNLEDSDFYWWYSSIIEAVKASSPRCRNLAHLGWKEGEGVRASLADQEGILSLLLAGWLQEKDSRNHAAGTLLTTLSICQNWFKIAVTQRAILQICIWASWTSHKGWNTRCQTVQLAVFLIQNFTLWSLCQRNFYFKPWDTRCLQ